MQHANVHRTCKSCIVLDISLIYVCRMRQPVVEISLNLYLTIVSHVYTSFCSIAAAVLQLQGTCMAQPAQTALPVQHVLP